MTKKGKKKINGTVGGSGLSNTFKEDDIVGAKVKGYPMWPAKVIGKVKTNNKIKYTVVFYGSNQTSQTISEIKHFKDFTPKELACKQPAFKEALALCEKEYNALQIKTDGSQSKTTIKHDNNETHIKEVVQAKPVITENIKIKQTLIKLSNKIQMKLKEKEDMKKEKKRKKITDKLFQKLEIINKNLYNLSKLTTNIKNENHSKFRSEWETAVQVFIKTLPALETCIDWSAKSNISKSPTKLANFQDCHKHLQSMCKEMRRFKDQKKHDVSDYRLEKINNIFDAIKKHKKIKEFVNDDYDKFLQDMIGRKENDDK